MSPKNAPHPRSPDPRSRPLASYGRRRGRKLRPGRQQLLSELLPKISIKLPKNKLAIASLFSSPLEGEGDERSESGGGRTAVAPPPNPLPQGEGEYWLEIGFGGGEHLAHQAARNPNTGIIGCEPYIDGVATLLKHINDEKLENIRIFHDDARLLIDQLPDNCLSRVFMLYPDPWPKTRHHKRRLVSRSTLDVLARVMKSGAVLRLATDHSDYCAWMFEQLLTHPQFGWQGKRCSDWLKPWADWIPTRYEQKRLAGMPTYLTFMRA